MSQPRVERTILQHFQVTGGRHCFDGSIELIQGSFEYGSLASGEPQFLSAAKDHQLACVKVHWLSPSAEGGQYCITSTSTDFRNIP